MGTKNLDIVGTYLSGLPGANGPGDERSGTEPLLGVLFSHPSPMRYRELWNAARLLGYSSDEFVAAYRLLRSRGAVSVSAGEGGFETTSADLTVTLTPLGRSVAQVERGRS